MTRITKLVITLIVAFAGFSVLLGTGQASNGSAVRYAAPSGGWQDVAPLPQTVFGPATASDGTYVYAIGGYHFPEAIGSTLDTVYRYDPTANTWTTMTPMPQPSLIASAVYYPPTNKIYVFGGATRTPDPLITYDTTLMSGSEVRVAHQPLFVGECDRRHRQRRMASASSSVMPSCHRS